MLLCLALDALDARLMIFFAQFKTDVVAIAPNGCDCRCAASHVWVKNYPPPSWVEFSMSVLIIGTGFGVG